MTPATAPDAAPQLLTSVTPQKIPLVRSKSAPLPTTRVGTNTDEMLQPPLHLGYLDQEDLDHLVTSKGKALDIYEYHFAKVCSKIAHPQKSFFFMTTLYRNAHLPQLHQALRRVSRLLVGRFGPYFELQTRYDPLKTFRL